MAESREHIIRFLQENSAIFRSETFEGYSTSVLLEMKRLLEVEVKAKALSEKYAMQQGLLQ